MINDKMRKKYTFVLTLLLILVSSQQLSAILFSSTEDETNSKAVKHSTSTLLVNFVTESTLAESRQEITGAESFKNKDKITNSSNGINDYSMKTTLEMEISTKINFHHKGDINLISFNNIQNTTRTEVNILNESITLASGLKKEDTSTQRSNEMEHDQIITSTEKLRYITDVSTHRIIPDTCKGYGDCKFASTVPYKFRFCHCDKECGKYGDCCEDSPFIHNIPKMRYLNCVPFTTRGQWPYGYFAIDRCPDHSKYDDINANCTSDNMFKVGPLVFNSRGTIYKNRYCAACHNETETRPFDIRLLSLDNTFIPQLSNATSLMSLLEKSLDNANQKFEMTPPENVFVDTRRCLFLEPPDPGLEDQCANNPINPMFKYVGGTTYSIRNRFCKHSLESHICIGKKIIVIILTSQSSLHGLYPLSVIFPFSTDDTAVCQDSVNELCIGTPLWYDHDVEKMYYFTSSVPISKTLQQQISILAGLTLSDSIKIRSITSYNCTQVSFQPGKYMLIIDVKGVLPNAYDTDTMLRKVASISNTKWDMQVSTSKGDVNQIKGENAEVKLNFLSSCVKDIKISSIDLNAHKIINSVNDLSYQGKECEDYLIECRLQDGGQHSRLRINKIECLGWTWEETMASLDMQLKVIAYTGFTTSFAACFITFVKNRISATHQKIYGFMYQNLLITLILSNILFMISIGLSDYQSACYYIGVILHDLLLTVFSLKTVLLAYVTSSIRNLLSNGAHKQTKNAKMLLTVISLSLPLLLVIVALIIDNTHASFRLQYNGGICFPTGYLASIVFVTIPIGVSVLISAICLLLILALVSKQSVKTSIVRMSASYNDAQVLAKISILTGVCWMFGIVHTFTDSQVIVYIFVIICSFQGVFVALVSLSSKAAHFQETQTEVSTSDTSSRLT